VSMSWCEISGCIDYSTNDGTQAVYRVGGMLLCTRHTYTRVLDRFDGNEPVDRIVASDTRILDGVPYPSQWSVTGTPANWVLWRDDMQIWESRGPLAMVWTPPLDWSEKRTDEWIETQMTEPDFQTQLAFLDSFTDYDNIYRPTAFQTLWLADCPPETVERYGDRGSVAQFVAVSIGTVRMMSDE
jgi:hypothetical protein